MERIGLVGLPNAGKTTLFNALCRASAPVGPHPFTTTETERAVALVPDERLEALASASRSRKVVHAGIEVVDPAALVAGSSKGEGLGNRFLAQLRELDALALVLRAFDDPGVPGETDPKAALEALELELAVADLASLDAQLARRRKQAQAAKGDRRLAEELEAMEWARERLAAGGPLWRDGLDADQRRRLAGSFLLTAKPLLVVVNIGDELAEAGAEADRRQVLEAVAGAMGGTARVVAIPARLEAELAVLDEPSARELRRELGLEAAALRVVAQAMAEVLGRWTFFTTGEKESRAWRFRAGSTARECAGLIHSDLAKGFVKAEVVRAEELLAAGSWDRAKQAGRVRLEGREYLVQDGDVLEIRFNV
jgi:GTP-binding protein YchF